MTVLTGQGFDHILDAAGSVDDWSKAPGVLKAGGDYVTIANFVSQKSPEDKVNLQHFMLKSCPSSDLDFLVDLVEKGVVKGLIDSVYDFEDAQAAFMKSFEMATKGSGAMGKLVVKVPQ
jgi:NADPH:quinone reductase-like Zn-dependent oxidoreductase